MKQIAVVAILLGLLSISPIFAAFPAANGQLGVNIFQVTPTQGVAGDKINVQGTIDTSDGEYRLYLSNTLVATNTSDGYYVNANFIVPELPSGTYTLTLRDVSERVNATSTFTLQTGYFIKALVPSLPDQLQEGDSVPINITVTGGTPGKTYGANVTVVLPSPLLTEYSQSITMTPSSQTGTAASQITFPSSVFQPSGSITNFTGSYKAYFNRTQSLAVDEFHVGFTNAAQYHRNELVIIRAVGYEAGQSSTISITSQQPGGGTLYTTTVIASNEGIMDASWTVPSNAAIGTYQVSINPLGTQKSIADIQNFTVPGYPVRFRALNLAGETVSDILIEAIDQATSAVYSGTTDSGGIAVVNLEKGEQNVTSYWNDVQVGQTSVLVTGQGQYDVTCQLTNLKIVVQDKNGFLIPSVSLKIGFRYTTTKGGISKVGSASGQTDLTGSYYLNSTLSGIDYSINASVYGRMFNSANNTFGNIPAVPLYQIVVLFPSQNLTLTVIDYHNNAVPNVRLAMGEVTSGIFYVATTDAQGSATLEVAFGIYQLRIYKDTVLLNESTIEVFENVQSDIHCTLYNLPVSVSVVDYFGQPIPGINVMYRGPDGTTRTGTTGANGVAVFDNVIGGNAQIVAYPNGQETNYEAVNTNIDSSATVQVKLGRFVAIGGFLIDIGLFVTVVIVLVVMVLFMMFELFRRRALKAKTTTKPSAPQANSANK